MKEVLSTPKTLRYDIQTPQKFDIAITKTALAILASYIYLCSIVAENLKDHYIFVPSIFRHIHPPTQRTTISSHHNWTPYQTEVQLPPSRSDPSNPSRRNVTQPLEGLLDLAYGSPTIGGRWKSPQSVSCWVSGDTGGALVALALGSIEGQI